MREARRRDRGHERGVVAKVQGERTGSRSQNLHRRRREVAGFGLRSIVVLAAGVGLILVAVPLLVIPGPGLLVLFFRLGIVASEILLTVRFMN
jgi:hypothetical protein